MSRFYENQFKTRFYGVTMKLSLLLIAILVGFSTTYAQSGKTIVVNSNESLLKALDNDNVEMIVLEHGYYEHFDITVQFGDKLTISRDEGGNIIFLSCTVSITTENTCWIDANSKMPVTAELVGTCDPPGPNPFWFKQSGPGDVVFDDIDNPNTNASVTVAGVYVLGFNWNNGPAGSPNQGSQGTSFARWFDTPTNVEANGDDVCGLTTNLTGTHDPFDHAPVIDYEWTVIGSPPGTVTFTTSTSQNPGVEVSAYGEYEFMFSVTNDACAPVTATVTVGHSR